MANATIGRPKKWQEKTAVRFYLEKETKKELQKYCIDNELTIQDLFEVHVSKILKERKQNA